MVAARKFPVGLPTEAARKAHPRKGRTQRAAANKKESERALGPPGSYYLGHSHECQIIWAGFGISPDFRFFSFFLHFSFFFFSKIYDPKKM
jgi:hypothetical protein